MATSIPETSSGHDVVLMSCYELGQEPLGLVVPAGLLERAGHSPYLVDVAVEQLPENILATASFIGISTPMHTALRLGVEAARRVRGLNPGAHICFYGIYAELNRDSLLDDVADSCLGAEFESELTPLVEAVIAGRDVAPLATTSRARPANRDTDLTPSRRGLRHRDQYVRLVHGAHTTRVGAVVSSRGCKHGCRHCPLPPVYDRAFYAIPVDVVLQDVAALVEAGVGHITFADPDFLNGPTHALRVARALHDACPSLTFDYTAKIEHLGRHRETVEALQGMGNLFVVSAVESLNDDVLAALDKGHTAAGARDAFAHFRAIGLALRPSLVPFTPWETLATYVDLLRAIEREGLIDNIDAVQYSVRLLVPPRSWLVDSPAMRAHLGDFDGGMYTYRWRHPDPAMDALHEEVAASVEESAERGRDATEAYAAVRRLAEDRCERAGGRPVPFRGVAASSGAVPRLTEAWFC